MTSRDALAILKEEHDRIRDLLHVHETVRVKGEDGDRERLLRRQIVEEVLEHKYLEERILYPIAAERLEGMKDFVLESLEEHHLISLLLAEVQDMPSFDERLHAKMSVLADLITRHGDKEEDELFPHFRHAVGDAGLSALAGDLDAARIAAPRSALMQQPSDSTAGMEKGDTA